MKSFYLMSNGALVVQLQADGVGIPTFADCCWRSALVYLFLLDHRLPSLYRIFLHTLFRSYEAHIRILHDLDDETSDSVWSLMGTGRSMASRTTTTMAGGTISLMSWRSLIHPSSWYLLTAAKSSKWLTLGQPQMWQTWVRPPHRLVAAQRVLHLTQN